jgi:NUMOD4 motif
MTEIWRVIPEFENYEVSEEGRVRSLARLVHMKNGSKSLV